MAARPDRLVWRYPEQAAPGARPLRNPPAEDSGGRLFLCSQEKVVAFLALPNEIRTLWEFSTGGYIPSSPAIGPDQRLRVHSSDGKLYLLDNAGNVCCAPTEVGEPLAWASPLVDENNTTWICAYQGGLLKIDAQGQLAKRPYFRTFEQFNSTGLLHGGRLYVGAEDNCVYAIQLDGPRGVNLWDHFADRGRTGWNINSALAVLGESAILVAGRDDHLHAFQLDGEKMWSVAMPGQMLGSPVVDEQGAAYVGVSLSRRGQASGGMLVRVDPNSHRIHWQYDVPAAIESTPVLGDDGMVYFGDNSGRVHAVDRNGQQAWTEQLASPIRSPGVLIGPGRVAFGLDDGSFVALRCSSQRLADRGWPKYLGTPQQHGISPTKN